MYVFWKNIETKVFTQTINFLKENVSLFFHPKMLTYVTIFVTFNFFPFMKCQYIDKSVAQYLYHW